MSENISFFNVTNSSGLANTSFPSNINFGFSLGSFDLLNSKTGLSNEALLRDENKENDHNKKGKKKGKGKFKAKQAEDGAAPNPEKFTGVNLLNIEEGNENSQTSQVCKASKKIRKHTLDKLKKRAATKNQDMPNLKSKSRMLPKKFISGKSLNPEMFYKTKICPHLVGGSCKRGENCNYAHSQSELKEPPNLKKTRVCQLFQIGKCNMGNLCSFAHGDQELRSTADFFKTSICHSFTKGTCRMGDKCRYAHGPEELRKISTSSNDYASTSTLSKDKEQPLPRTNLRQNNFGINPINSIDMTASNTQLKNDGSINGSILSGFNAATLPGFSAQLNNNNITLPNISPSFGGFSLGPKITQNPAPEQFTTSNMFSQAFSSQLGTKSVEKKPAQQASLPVDFAFNTFNPDMLASILSSASNTKSFFN